MIQWIRRLNFVTNTQIQVQISGTKYNLKGQIGIMNEGRVRSK